MCKIREKETFQDAFDKKESTYLQNVTQNFWYALSGTQLRG